MCGIAGYWARTPVPIEGLAVFTDMLAHRGPDGVGHLTADGRRLGLGHRRLAILDPDDRSRQPMVSENGRYAIVFNGEIYNFLEIRSELSAKGHTFRTESDTEVILHAFREWGPGCEDRFNGMWAFVIWDGSARRLYLSRDRFGVKPLYVLEGSHGTAFASEPKAFLALPWVDSSEIGRGIADSAYAADAIRLLRGGMHATVDGPGRPLRVDRWWRPLHYLKPRTSPYSAQVEGFRDLFFDACRLRLRSDVSIGTAISGGLDSSSVLAAVNVLGAESVARRPQDWSRAFTIVASGTEHDELEYASAACAAAGVEPTVIDLFARANPGDIDEYLYLTEGMPLTNLPAWYLYRSMREQGIRVSLDGQGADEILAGYSWDVARILQLEGAWLRRPRRTLDLVRTLTALTRNSPYNPMSAKTIALSSSPLLRRMVELLPAQIPAVVSENHDAATWEEAKTLQPVNAVLFMAINDSIQNLLQRYDLLSMSSGLEIRMPFMDWRLASYTLSLPGDSIIGNGFTKRILRDAMAPYLPPKVRARKRKLQFQGPIRQLLRGALRPWLDSHPELSRLAGDAMTTGNNRQIREWGVSLVAEWKRRTYLPMAKAKIMALSRQHRADLGLVAERARELR